ncbi:hypothetical protein MNBD_GAMMA21-2546 [hydrothermal vent metagenome]|uniref:Uncharacterized protein n=1 Tax=hydrothermal vent metagenome TaxID=652676 RepID=A0A3B0ZSZ7_9ZZZZ
MLKQKQPVRVLAHLLIFAISLAQISVVSASIINPEERARVESHCLNTDGVSYTGSVTSNSAQCLHMQQLAEKNSCCQSGDCADNACVAGAHCASTAVFLSQTRLPNRIYNKSAMEAYDQLQVGVSSASLYRPPR